MSLYHEAARILTAAQTHGGSLKTHIFSPSNAITNGNTEPSKGKNDSKKENNKKAKPNPKANLKTNAAATSSSTSAPSKSPWKSDPRTLYALTISTIQLSSLLTPLITSSQLLHHESRNLTPLLALLLTHDLLFAKRGIALPATHGLAKAILRHKTRLVAELGRARVKAGCADLAALKAQHEAAALATSDSAERVRWVRINSIKTDLAAELAEGGVFENYECVATLAALINTNTSGTTGKLLLHVDKHIPNLLALPFASTIALTSSKAYREGRIIFQDKASCFPAYLLDQAARAGDVIDACAAPGNKTTHLAAIAQEKCTSTEDEAKTKIFACEKDAARSKTLEKMVRNAGCGENVVLKLEQNFLKLDPHGAELGGVTGLVLDPSCSGSGIVGREGGKLELLVPELPVPGQPAAANNNSKKRKRPQHPDASKALTIALPPSDPDADAAEEEEQENDQDQTALQTRLTALSSFQLRLLLHAMAFLHATRIVYSTCSIHATENEDVVVKALLSDVAKGRNWRVLRRREQVEGVRDWGVRGDTGAVEEGFAGLGKAGMLQEVSEACVRCVKGGGEGTMGFFVCGFVRDEGAVDGVDENGDHPNRDSENGEDSGDEWGGFGDDD